MGIMDSLRECSCLKVLRFLLRLLYWVPVAFVLLIVVWGYYVYVYLLNLSGETVEESQLINTSYKFMYVDVDHNCDIASKYPVFA